MDAKCPACKAPVTKARLVFVETDTLTTKLHGPLPEGGLAYACNSCGVLLPVAPITGGK